MFSDIRVIFFEDQSLTLLIDEKRPHSSLFTGF